MLTTKRLHLRQWTSADLPVFAELNADPEVMRYFPQPLSTLESNALAAKLQQLIVENGWGFWAVALKKSGIDRIDNDNAVNKDCHPFMGFVGLHMHSPSADLPCSPCVEIGWRLHKKYWGMGYATEAATAVLQFAFTQLDLEEVVSFTAVTNSASQAVMQRIGMSNTGKNFYHPALAPEHPLAEHVLYNITQAAWQNLG